MKPTNDHLKAEELFSAYIDNRVTADEQSFVERHTAACADCHAKLQAARSLVAAMRAMPVVKAPRSFVLPREMARQPQRSILAWYSALRLATALAVVALVLVFAGDLFTASYGSSMNMPASVPQAASMPTAAPGTANKVIVVTHDVAAAQATNAPAPAAAATLMMDQTQSADATSSAAAQLTVPQPAPALPTATMMVPAAGAGYTASAAPAVTSTGEVTVARASVPQATPTTEPVSETATAISAGPEAAPTNGAAPLDPLRLIEIVLGGLVIIFGVATLIARQRAS